MTHPLLALEHSLWRAETRYDLLPDGETHPIDAALHAVTVTDLRDAMALVTYLSELRRPTGSEWANRASLWDCTSGSWQLRFHQGTPCEAPT